ncbi:MAG TPA: hypothetical protein VGI99_14330 [Gemmataceae bacterium]|jgi:flagellar motility protein MotE (MotC chaperone)
MNVNPPIPEACVPTLERIQAVLDRIHPSTILASDAHPVECAACRQRVRAARLLLDSFANPPVIAIPAGFTDTIVASVRADRRRRLRQRFFAVTGGSLVAAAVALAVWLNQPKAAEFANVAPLPEAKPQPAAAPPLRFNEELAKAGAALRESSRTITEPAASTPKVFAALTDSLLNASASSTGIDLGPAEKSLAEIPDAARVGLEPVTGTAQKALNRLLHDVSGMQPKLKS